MYTRFDLEDAIMKVWNTTDDFKIIYESVCDTDLTEDQIANLLLGATELHNIKCRKLFDIFEKLVNDGVIKGIS